MYADPHSSAMTMTMTAAETDIHVPPIQFKGEIMDFDLGIEVDHRKRYARLRPAGIIPCSRYPANSLRRRNRTTQSCLNCHTSKRKVIAIWHCREFRLIEDSQCDRKRPCQRCIQLGLVRTIIHKPGLTANDVFYKDRAVCV